MGAVVGFFVHSIHLAFSMPGGIHRPGYSGAAWVHNKGRQGGEDMARDVMCTVENCRFWANRHCTAEAIEVNVDGGGHTAGYTGETNCHTFADKKKS